MTKDHGRTKDEGRSTKYQEVTWLRQGLFLDVGGHLFAMRQQLRARIPAFAAPDAPMATVATGMPFGICTVDNSESNPESALVIGTPITGTTVWAATTPARCAAPPAPAMMTSMPRAMAPDAYSATTDGVRCADITRLS
jgi:hypothetical protein